MSAKDIKKDDIPLQTLFHKYKNDRVQPYGEVPGMTVHEWIAKRKEVYRRYQEIFHPKRLNALEHVKRNFCEWLQFKNNLSWTTLHRKGYNALEDPEKLSNLLSILQNEDIPISKRVNMGFNDPTKVPGIGKATLTALLHTFYPMKYGVVTSKTINSLSILGKRPAYTYGESRGDKYVKINTVLRELATQLDTDLVYVDGFMGYISKNY